MGKVINFPSWLDPTDLTVDEVMELSRRRTMALAHAILCLHLPNQPTPLPEKVFIAYGSNLSSDSPQVQYLASGLSAAELERMVALCLEDLRQSD